jgi:prepilin-type N-terminal cleavage/methylation domain-containing protein
MSRPRRNSAGFTLIESMIVLLIFGIVIIGIIPSFLSSINRARLTTAAQSISALMHSARLEAIKRGNQGSAAALSTTGTNGRVEVDFPTKTVIAYVDLDGDQTRSAGDVHLGTVTLGKDLEFHGPGPMATAKRRGDLEFRDPAQRGRCNLQVGWLGGGFGRDPHP